MSSSDPSRRHALGQIVVGLTAALLVCAAARLFNAVIDPYGTIGWIKRPGFNLEKPAQQTRVRMVKAAEVRRIRPRAIVLGTSRSHVGLRMSHPGWKAQPRYNLGFDGATPEEMYAYLQHAAAMAPLKQVVLGLDTWQLEEYPTYVQPDFDPELLARPGQPWTKLRMHLADLKLLLSLDTLEAANNTLHAQSGPPSKWFAPDGQRLGPEFFHRAGEEFAIKGPRAYFLAVDRQEIGFELPPPERPATVGPPPPAAVSSFEYIRKIVFFCREHAIDLRIYITPAHAHQMEIATAMGQWDRIGQGKRDLVHLLAADSEAHHTPLVPVWDFSGYSSVTEEALPQEGSGAEMRFYWDSSHFKQEVGDWVLDRLFGTARAGHPVPEDFGQLLTLTNIETVLASQRQAHAAYVSSHPWDMNFILGTIAELRGESLRLAGTNSVSF